MPKKILSAALCFLFAACAFAAAKTPVEVSGKNKSGIETADQNGLTFINALPAAKLLKMQTSWFSKSGQLNVQNSGGYFAVLRAGKTTAAVNGKEESLEAAPFLENGNLFVPLSFFTQGSLAKASGFTMACQDGKIVVEKDFQLQRAAFDITETSAKILFTANAPLKQTITPRAGTRVDITFPKTIIKREETLTDKNDFISRAVITQKGADTQIMFLLKGAAKHWDFYQNPQGGWVFEASSQPISRPAPGPAPKPQPAPKPSVLEEGAIIEAAPAPVVIKPAPPVIIAPKPAKKGRRIRLMIDAGHGGKDPGATYRSSSREKEINLAVAEQLYNLLKKDKNFEVKMTREKDVFITLGGRAKMANDFKADIFVSIHANAAKRAGANGFEVYFRSDKASDAEAAATALLENEALQYEDGNGGSVSFAQLLLKSLATTENMNESSKIASHIRGGVTKNSGSIGIKVYQETCIKQANFYVLQGVQAPSVLIEMGFLSNAGDKKRLNNKTARNKLAESIKDGLISYAKAEGWY